MNEKRKATGQLQTHNEARLFPLAPEERNSFATGRILTASISSYAHRSLNSLLVAVCVCVLLLAFFSSFSNVQSRQ